MKGVPRHRVMRRLCCQRSRLSFCVRGVRDALERAVTAVANGRDVDATGSAVADRPAPEVDAGATPFSRRRFTLTLGLLLTISVVAFETLAVATILPAVVADLGGLDLYGWAFSAFLLTQLVCSPPPAPPDNIDTTLPPPDPTKSARQQLVELTGTDSARFGRAARRPRVSAPSLYLVPVPCALT